jgi:hypothetical protein
MSSVRGVVRISEGVDQLLHHLQPLHPWTAGDLEELGLIDLASGPRQPLWDPVFGTHAVAEEGHLDRGRVVALLTT